MKKVCIIVPVCVALIILFVLPCTPSEKKEWGEPIKIGIIGAMKFAQGKSAWRGATIAAEEINESGGILLDGKGHKIKLIKADSNELASVIDAVNAMVRLITVNKVNFVVGGYRSEACLAMQEVIADNQFIWLNSTSGSPKMGERVKANYGRYKYYFKTNVRNSPAGPTVDSLCNLCVLVPVIKEVREKLGIATPRVAVIMDKAAYTDPAAAAAKKFLPLLGAEHVGEWRTEYQATDMTAELNAIKNAGAHIIYTSFAGGGGVTFDKQWGELKIPAAVGGTNNEACFAKHWGDTVGLCNYVSSMAWGPRGPITEKTMPFIKKFYDRYGEYLTCPDNHTYDSLYILKDAIERGNTLDHEKLVPVLENTNYIGVTGRFVFSSMDHKAPHIALWGPDYGVYEGMQWQDGKQVVFWPDGKELPKALVEAGAGSGWKDTRTGEYILPPWVVKYWKK